MKALNKQTGQLEKVYVKALDSNPVGSVMEYLGTIAPKNYLLLDGEIYNINQYPQLANLIKDTFGSYNYFGGNGTTTFGLPDMRGRVPVGVDVRDVDFETIGKIGGSKELQEHGHNILLVKSRAFPLNEGAGTAAGPSGYNGDNGGTMTNTSAIGTAGTGDSGNLQPYMAWNFIIKAVNTTPTGAHIVDGYSTSTTDGYSCNEVNNLVQDVYSTNEVKTNEIWIDNRPIYRKVCVYTTSIPVSSAVTIPWSTLGIDVSIVSEITDLKVKSGSGIEYFPLPRSHNSSFNFQCAVNTNSSGLVIETGSNFSASRLVATFEYTKTTD